MNTLHTIQVLAKIGRILSKIIFICCIVGFCFCIAGIIAMAFGLPGLKVGDVTIQSIVQQEAEVSVGQVYAGLTVGAVFCAGEAVLSKFAEHYFTRELRDGTPFNFGGARELMRLGILAICIPIVTVIAANIANGAFMRTMEGVEPLEDNSFGSVSLGIMMIVTSLICRYGAEQKDNAVSAAEEY